jgi:hypothetical protein
VNGSPGEKLGEGRTTVILTPDQRVGVFISSTLEELAEERSAALRAIRRLHLVPVWLSTGSTSSAAEHVSGLPGAESDLCRDLTAAVWLGRAWYGDLGSGG